MNTNNYEIKYVKGKYNWVAYQLSRPVLVIQRPPVETILGKTQEEMRELQLREEGWRQLIEYLEGGQLPTRRYPKCTLNQFTLWEGVLYYSVTKKDGSVHFCLVVPQELKKEVKGGEAAGVGG